MCCPRYDRSVVLGMPAVLSSVCQVCCPRYARCVVLAMPAVLSLGVLTSVFVFDVAVSNTSSNMHTSVV